MVSGKGGSNEEKISKLLSKDGLFKIFTIIVVMIIASDLSDSIFTHCGSVIFQ